MTTSPRAVGAHDAGFAYRREQFQQIVEDTLALARQMGASDAGAEVSEGVGLSVSVRMGSLENVERNRDKSLGVSVYLGQRRGNASTSDFSAAALRQTVQAAYDIARFTAEDPAAGLPDAEDLATPAEAARDLDLFHPWAIDAAAAAELARRCEAAALSVDRRITNSEGAGVSAQQAHFWAGNTRGFRGGYASSRHYLSVSPIAGKGKAMQRDAWYSSMRDASELAAPEAVGRYAAERALARLKSRRVPTAKVPVLFESTVAAGLLGASCRPPRAARCTARPASCWIAWARRCWPTTWTSAKTRTNQRQGQRPLRRRRRAHRARRVVDGGVVQGYFLSSYSARKLGMKTTGHAGGSQNLVMTSRKTRPGDNLDKMLAKLGRGLFVTELMGQGVNYVTGDYSRGAAGFWVEDGRIAYPVHEVTIAGHLREMFRHPRHRRRHLHPGQQDGGLGADRPHEAGRRLANDLGPRASPFPDCCAADWCLP
jgi:PmbA protein